MSTANPSLFGMARVALARIDRGAWIRFFIAIIGLALAFAAAIFSTVMRRDGNVLGTAVAASLALLIAGGVALGTVPYLMRRVAVESFKDTLDYDVTREGVVYLGIALVIGVAALNTGNNLLFIVISAMLGSILISGIASAAVLRGLKLDVSIPEHIFAGTPVLGRLTLQNRRPFLPCFSISVVPPKQKKAGKKLRWEKSVFTFPPKRMTEEQWVRWKDLSLRYSEDPVPRAGIFGGSVYFPYIRPGQSVRSDVELNFPRRGRYIQDGFGAATRFPFSFLVKTRRIPLLREIVVYPPVEQTDELFEILPMITGEFETFVRGRGYDLYRIREYMPEDTARHVDWKATARSGALKVREFTREDERKLRIVFDNPPAGQVRGAQYERGIQLAASLAWHFAGEDTELSFAATGLRSGAGIYDFLEYLALAEPAEGENMLEKLEITDDYNVIITARPHGSIPTQLWASSYFLFMQDKQQ